MDSIPRYYRDVDMARALGCSRSTIWRWVANGVIPRPLKIGGLARFTDDHWEAIGRPGNRPDSSE